MVDHRNWRECQELVPHIEGMEEFGGTIIHTSWYRRGNAFRGKMYCLLGMEVCLDLCNHKRLRFWRIILVKVAMVLKNCMYVCMEFITVFFVHDFILLCSNLTLFSGFRFLFF